MVFFYRWTRSFWKSDFFRRIFKLQKNFKNIRISRTHKKKILSIVLIVASVFLGNLAYEASKKEALDEWEIKHAPSSKTWIGLLKTHGFLPLTQSAQIEKLYRSLPVSLHDRAQLWVGDSWNWVALSTHEFFCISCEILPHTWGSQDKNWRTYYEIESQLESIQKPSKFKKRAEIYDPREIRY